MKIPGYLCNSALVLALALFAFACKSASSNGGEVVTPIATPNATGPIAPLSDLSQNPEDKMPRVSAAEAINDSAAGKAVIIDVRGTEAYKMSHIKGALDIPLGKIEAGDFKGLPRDKRIIAYCT